MAHVLDKMVDGAKGKQRRVWLARWVDADTGKRKEKSFATRIEAERHAAGITLAAGQRRLRPREERASHRTWGEVADAYMESLAVPTGDRDALRRSTREAHQGRIDNHTRPVLGDKRVDLLTDADLVRLRDHLLGLAITRRTARESLRLARAVLGHALDLGLITTLPGASVTIARTVRERQTERDHHDAVAYTPDQVWTFLRAADSLAEDRHKQVRKAWARYRGLVYLAVYTGLRISEVRGLRRRDLDLDRGWVSVVQSADVFGGLDHTKSMSGRRRVPFHLDAVDPIKAALNARPGEPSDLAFASEEGTPLGDSNLRKRLLNPLVARAKELADDCTKTDTRLVRVPAHGWHGLRHAYASRLIAAGADLKCLQTYMGHHDAGFTLRVYGHLLPDRHAEMVARLSV